MRVLLNILIAAISCIFAVHPSVAEELPSVTIEYLAHASFVILAPDGKRLLIDPYADRVWIGYDFPKAGDSRRGIDQPSPF